MCKISNILLILLCLYSCSQQSDRNLAIEGELFHSAFLQLIDENRFEPAYSMLMPEVQRETNFSDFVAYIKTFRKGEHCSRQASGYIVTYDFSSAEDRTAVSDIVWMGKYYLSCQGGGDWLEQVVVMYDTQSNQFQIRNYSISTYRNELNGLIRPISEMKQRAIQEIKDRYILESKVM